MAQKPQLFSGPRGQIKVAGTVLAYVTDISMDSPASVRAIHAFGSSNARSVEPLSVGPVTVSFGRVIPVNDSKGAPVDSSMISAGIEPVIQSMLTADDITVELIDKVTGATYASVRNCRFTGRGFSMSATQLASERISLMGIYDAGSTANGAAKNSPSKIGF